jgi:4a-hydroxytetrahydrobiopterin dehydratase
VTPATTASINDLRQRIMTKRAPLADQAIEKAVNALDGWSLRDDALVRDFEFADFRAAISFIVRLAFFAEEMNHHPEITNVYNRVRLRLTTHDAGDRVTQLDVDLARAINDFSWV